MGTTNEAIALFTLASTVNKVALNLLQVIGIKEYAVKTMYKHTNQDDGLMSIVDLAKVAESYKMETELDDELLQQL